MAPQVYIECKMRPIAPIRSPAHLENHVLLKDGGAVLHGGASLLVLRIGDVGVLACALLDVDLQACLGVLGDDGGAGCHAVLPGDALLRHAELECCVWDSWRSLLSLVGQAPSGPRGATGKPPSQRDEGPPHFSRQYPGCQKFSCFAGQICRPKTEKLQKVPFSVTRLTPTERVYYLRTV